MIGDVCLVHCWGCSKRFRWFGSGHANFKAQSNCHFGATRSATTTSSVTMSRVSELQARDCGCPVITGTSVLMSICAEADPPGVGVRLRSAPQSSSSSTSRLPSKDVGLYSCSCSCPCSRLSVNGKGQWVQQRKSHVLDVRLWPCLSMHISTSIHPSIHPYPSMPRTQALCRARTLWKSLGMHGTHLMPNPNPNPNLNPKRD